MQFALDEEVPCGISVPFSLELAADRVLDSVCVSVAGVNRFRLIPQSPSQQFSLQYIFEDTLRTTPVGAEAYWAGRLVGAATDSTHARSVGLELDAPDSVLKDSSVLLIGRVHPANLFSTLRLTTQGLDTLITVPPGAESYTLSIPTIFREVGDDTVLARAVLRCGPEINAQKPIHIYQQIHPGEINGSLEINPAVGVWPLQTEARILAYPQNLIDTLRFNKGEGPDTVIAHPDSLTVLPLLYGSRGEYLARAAIIGRDSSIFLTQLVQAVNAQHYLNLLVDPSEGTEPLLANILASFGTTLGNDSLIRRLNLEFGDGADTTILNPQSPASIDRTYLRGNYTIRAILTARDTVIIQERLLHVSILPPITYNASLNITPNQGDAPLITSANIQVQSSRPDTLSVLYNRGFGPDTAFCMVTPANILIPATYDVGNFTARASIQGRDSLIILERPVQSRNTPPDMNLPSRTAYEDSSMTDVNLDDYTSDRQSPDSLLNFEILSQQGPATASLENHVLRFALQQDQNGSGNVTVRVTDPHGGQTTRTLNYDVLPMTDLRISLADLETLEPLSNGIVTINGQDYFFGDTLHTQVLPGGIIPVRAVHTLNDQIYSFERTADINTATDLDTTILVSTYYALQEQGGISPFRYRTFVREGRQGLAEIGGEWRAVLKKIDFTNAYLGFENGGYTWWIGKTHPVTGLQFTDDEQITVENIILAGINPNIIHSWARPPSYRATLQDSSYFIEGYGTTRDGLIPSYKSPFQSLVYTYDRNFDGTIESAFIELIQFLPQGHIIQENASALAFPNEIGIVDSTLLPNETVLHRQSTRSTMSRADIKALNEAINLPAAEELDRAYHIRQ